MQNYLEVTVDETQGLPGPAVMSALYERLHQCVLARSCGTIGVSFPEYQKNSLGLVIRLHGPAASLEVARGTAASWLGGLLGLVNISSVLEIPEAHEYRIFRRVQDKTNLRRLYRRSVRNGKISKQDAADLVAKKIRAVKAASRPAPYLWMASASTGKKFLVQVEQEKASGALPGRFSGYGLSRSAAVPWF